MRIYCRGSSRLSHAGFTLIELIVVLTILIVLAGVVILCITPFLGSGKAEAKALEKRQLETSAGCYITDGKSILAPFIVYPQHLGVLQPYLNGDIKYRWWIDTGGRVTEVDPSMVWSSQFQDWSDTNSSAPAPTQVQGLKYQTLNFSADFTGNGNDSYVWKPDSPELDLTTEGTLMAWVKVDSFNPNGSDCSGIIHKGSQGDFSDEAYSLQFWPPSGTVALFRRNDSGVQQQVNASAPVATGQWQQIVATWDSSTVKIYINGVLSSSASNTIGASMNSSGDLVIGAQLTTPIGYWGHVGLDGSIDQVNIYRRSVTGDEIQQNYNQFKP